MISVWIAVAWLLGSVVIIALATLAILFLAYRARVPGFVSQVRSARYVVTYEDALQWLGVRYRERDRLVGELRANIAAATADAPMREVLDRMGPAKELARGVAARRRGPTWFTGTVAAFVAVAVHMAATMLMQLTFLATVEEVASPGQSVSVHVPVGLLFEGTLGGSGTVQAFSLTASAAGVVFPVVAFILFSRPWRLFTARAARRAAEI